LNTLSECIWGCESVWKADHAFKVLAYTPYGENVYKSVCKMHRFQWSQVAKMAQCLLIKIIANFLRHSCLDSAVIKNLQFGIPVYTGIVTCLSPSWINYTEKLRTEKRPVPCNTIHRLICGTGRRSRAQGGGFVSFMCFVI